MYYQRGYTTISNGRFNGRSSYQSLMNGRVTITGTDDKGRNINRVVQIVDGEIMDNKFRVDGQIVHHVAYGRFETEVTPAGREVTRFHKGTGKGKHGKSVRYGQLFGHDVAVHSWYKQGRLVRQKVIYTSGKLAYDWRGRGKEFIVYNGHPMFAGEQMYRITGELSTGNYHGGYSVLDRGMGEWFSRRTPFKVERYGGKGEWELWYAGEYSHNQKVGRWIEEGKVVFYEHGVAIPEDLFNTPPAKLNLKALLRLPNAQLRMAMLEKAREDRNFGKRLAQIGKEVHRDGTMRLYHVKGLHTRVLRVVCPSTNSRYFINVPLDSKSCESARQWTFHLGAGVRLNAGQNEIKFTQET